MQLKGLKNRAYNVLFHTHTVAGIVLSVMLFVIFYAGAFSIFRHDIHQWEDPEARILNSGYYDVDRAISEVDSLYNLDFVQSTNIIFPTEDDPFLKVYGATRHIDDGDSLPHIERMGAAVVPISYQVKDIFNPKTTLGSTIYVLHYFGQIPIVGLYISGFTALFFLFATITGVLIHWRNLFTKFYAFIKEGKWKTIWTNAHTVLGMIGLPFQVIYAITGAFFGLLTLVLAPTVLLLYDGDASKVFNQINPENGIVLDENAADANNISLNILYEQVKAEYPETGVAGVLIRNYGKEDALATWRLNGEGVLSSGTAVMYMRDGIILDEYSNSPKEISYSQSVINLISKLHFANFGGIFLRLIYFVLAMITCFMILSGVLIWRTARDNNKYTFRQRTFHHRVTKVYLAISMSMFPAFAIIFLANKFVPLEINGRIDLVNQIFFISWLALIILGLFWNNYSKLNRNYLFLGGILSIFIPLANGLVTGDWFWKTFESLPKVMYVDIFWTFTGLTALILVLFILDVKKGTDKPQPALENKKRETSVVEERPLFKKPRPSINKPTPHLAINSTKGRTE